MKPGYKTTEFWLSFAAVLLGFVMASGAIAEGSQAERIVGMAVSTLAALGYSASRTQVKRDTWTTDQRKDATDGPELPQ